MFHELTGDPHDSSAVQSALRLQLRQARLAKKKPTCPQVPFPAMSDRMSQVAGNGTK